MTSILSHVLSFLYYLNVKTVYFTDNELPNFVNDGAKLDRYLFGRHIPLEPTEVFSAKKQIERDILSKKSEVDGILNSGELNKKAEIT